MGTGGSSATPSKAPKTVLKIIKAWLSLLHQKVRVGLSSQAITTVTRSPFLESPRNLSGP